MANGRKDIFTKNMVVGTELELINTLFIIIRKYYYKWRKSYMINNSKTKTFFISDVHFGDKGQLYLQKRPFKDTEEMDTAIINNWNRKVSRCDHVWIIGDLISHAHHSFYHYLRQLNGQKHLIIGNHDYDLIRDKKALSYFVSVDEYRTIRYMDKKIVLSHYPLAEWNGYYRGVYHIYGHIHGYDTLSSKYMMNLERAYNAGCMLNNFEPVTFEELLLNNKIWKETILE